MMESTPGGGTTFGLNLPADNRQERPQEIVPAAIVTDSVHKGRILLMDDEVVIHKENRRKPCPHISLSLD